MKLSKLFFLSGLAFISFSIESYSSSGGVLGQSVVGCGPSSCHGSSASSATSVSLSQSGALSALPGETFQLTAVVAHSSKSAAGINISATGGTLAVVAGGGLLKAAKELTHNGPKTMANGTASFPFSWTAPATPGTYTLNIAGNAVNLDGNTSGDAWNKTQITITVGTSSVEENSLISHIEAVPNPVIDQTIISTVLDEPAEISVSIIDANGNFVRHLIKNSFFDEGEKNFFWDGRNDSGAECSNGAYRVIISSKSGYRSQGIVLMK